MTSRIVFIQGSPRKNGNTRAISEIAINSAEVNGAEVTEIDVTALAFKEPGCIGCRKCQESAEFICALNDEVAEKVATLPEYNVIVLATPLYWWSYSPPEAGALIKDPSALEKAKEFGRTLATA